jgi:transcriptional regulator with XRE-family HTH domain
MPKKSGLETPREIAIGERVKRFRDLINWPQPAFAAELGISRDKLASIEYGRTPLRYAIGYRLCFIFDVNHHWLTTGDGEIKAVTAALELPPPERVKNRAIWSKAWDGHHPGGPRKSASAAATKSKKSALIPRFDPKAHVISSMNDFFAKEKFGSPLERQEFALEITSYARELALRMRRVRTGERYLAVSGGRRETDSGQGKSGAASTRNTGAVARLRASIRQLELHAKKLNTAMEKMNPAPVNLSSVPHSTEPEVRHLQEAIEKIAGQIDGAGARLKILLAKRGTA